MMYFVGHTSASMGKSHYEYVTIFTIESVV